MLAPVPAVLTIGLPMLLKVTEFEYFHDDDNREEWLGPPSETRSMTLDETVVWLNEFLDQETAHPGGMVDSYEPHFALYLWASDWETEETVRKVVQFVPETDSDREAMVEALKQLFHGTRASEYHFKVTQTDIIHIERLRPPASGRKYVFMVTLEGNILHQWKVLVVVEVESGKPLVVTRFWDYSKPGWYDPGDPRFGPGLTPDPVLRSQLRDKAIRTLVAACEAGISQLTST